MSSLSIQNQTQLTHLPDELIVLIFSLLDPETLAKVASVCTRFQAIAHTFPRMYQLNECIPKIPSFLRENLNFDKDPRKTYLFFWRNMHRGSPSTIRTPDPLHADRLISDIENEQKQIISFCMALPDEIKATLHSLNRDDLPLEAKAKNLLRELDNETVRSVTSLNLSGKNLTSIPENILQAFKKLSSIDLSKNQLTKVPSTLFHGLDLTNVNLAGNNLEEVPSTLFQGHTNLFWIDLSNNLLQKVPADLFQGNTLEINLSRNKLREVPATLLLRLPGLQKIDLSRNQLRNLPDIFKGHRSLQEIQLSYNELTEVPPYLLHDLPNLRQVDLYCNHLKMVPATFYEGHTASIKTDFGLRKGAYNSSITCTIL